MMTLLSLGELLGLRPYKNLRLVSARLGVRQGEGKQTWIEAITRFWFDDERRSNYVKRLSPQAKQALAYTVQAKTLPIHLFLGQYGPLRIPSHQHSALPHPPLSAAEELYLCGLIHLLPALLSPHARVVMAADLGATLLVDLFPSPTAKSQDADDSRVSQPLPDLLRDFAQLLAFLHQYPQVRFFRGRWLRSVALVRLCRRLVAVEAVTHHTQSPYLCWLFFLLWAGGFYRKDGLTAKAWVYLDASPAGQLLQLWQIWLTASTAQRTRYRITEGRFTVAWSTRFVHHLLQTPMHLGFTVTQLAQAILGAENELDAYFCAHFSTLRSFEEDLAVSLEQMRALGIVTGDEGHPLYQLTTTGRFLLSPQSNPTPAWHWSSDLAVLDVQHRSVGDEARWRIALAVDTSPKLAVRLAAFAQGGAFTSQRQRYVLTQRSLARSAANGRGLPELLQTLDALGIKLGPQELAQLHQWHAEGNALRLVIAPLLCVENPHLMAKVRALPELQPWIATILSPTTALWRGKAHEVVRALRQAGFFPNVTALAATRPSKAEEKLQGTLEAGAFWLAGQLAILLARFLPLSELPPTRQLQALFATLTPLEQVTLQVTFSELEANFRDLLDGVGYLPPPQSSEPERWRPLLERAMAEQRGLEMRYFSPARNLVTRRTIRPYWFIERKGIAYMEAYCEQAGEVLVFRLDRIQALNEIAAEGDPPAGEVEPQES